MENSCWCAAEGGDGASCSIKQEILRPLQALPTCPLSKGSPPRRQFPSGVRPYKDSCFNELNYPCPLSSPNYWKCRQTNWLLMSSPHAWISEGLWCGWELSTSPDVSLFHCSSTLYSVWLQSMFSRCLVGMISNGTFKSFLLSLRGAWQSNGSDVATWSPEAGIIFWLYQLIFLDWLSWGTLRKYLFP